MNDYDPCLTFQQVKQFFDEDGKLKSYPAKYKKMILVLFYLAQRFEPGVTYTEREVNELLSEWSHFDIASLRCDLYELGFLNRQKDGSSYWFVDEQPKLADFGLSL